MGAEPALALHDEFVSDGLRLAAHLAGPTTRSAQHAGVVLCHGFPSGRRSTPKSAHTYPQLAERIAEAIDGYVLAFNFRGCRPSEGEFWLEGWREDIRAAVDHLVEATGVSWVGTVGFGTGGALCVVEAASDERVRAVATVGGPADFGDWARSPRRLLDHARSVGLIADDSDVAFDQWVRALRENRAVDAAAAIRDRSLLVMHGLDDDSVPVLDARAVADAHGAAELKLIGAAGHQLRHDPRAVAVLVGWLDRQQAVTEVT